MTQFGYLDQMKTELDAASLDLEVHLLGVNRIGYEDGNASMCAGRTLPWLQDIPEEDAWGDWQVTSRDVVILDGDNQLVTKYNLDAHPLGVPANYEELKALLAAAATN